MKLLRRLKPWQRWTALAVAVVGAMVVAWYRVDTQARRELAAAKAAFAAHGFPTRIEEILPAAVPENQNADTPLRDAWAIVSGQNTWDASRPTGVFDRILDLEVETKSPVSGEFAIDPARLEELTKLVTDPEVARFTTAAYVAVRRSTWRRDLDYRLGPQLLLPHLGPLRNIIKLLTRRALVLAQDPATVDAAWEDLRAAQTIADWVDEEPTLISHLAGIASRGMVRATVTEVLSRGASPSPSTLDGVVASNLTSLAHAAGRLENAAHMERLAMFTWIEGHLNQTNDWLHALAAHGDLPRWVNVCDPWLTPVLSPVARPRLTMEFREGYERHLDIALALHAGGPSMVARLSDITREMESSRAIVPRIVIPAYSKFATTHLIDLTERRAFVVLLATLAYRTRTERWPDTISDLALPAELLTDACSATPLRLGIEAESLVVWGIGFDRDDDGGRAVDRSKGPDSDGDIVVRVRLKT